MYVTLGIIQLILFICNKRQADCLKKEKKRPHHNPKGFNTFKNILQNSSTNLKMKSYFALQEKVTF